MGRVAGRPLCPNPGAWNPVNDMLSLSRADQRRCVKTLKHLPVEGIPSDRLSAAFFSDQRRLEGTTCFVHGHDLVATTGRIPALHRQDTGGRRRHGRLPLGREVPSGDMSASVGSGLTSQAGAAVGAEAATAGDPVLRPCRATPRAMAIADAVRRASSARFTANLQTKGRPGAPSASIGKNDLGAFH
jgi:hypothetical protein